MRDNFEDKSVVLSREQCRRAKFQVKSITHSVNKLLKLRSIEPLVAKELNLMLDFCGRIMHELQHIPIPINDQGRMSRCDSISSKGVEKIGIKGLQKYKQISENFSFSTNPMPRSEINKSEVSMKIENQGPKFIDERVKQVKTSHSQSRGDMMPSDVQEYRIKQINHDLMMNSKQMSEHELKIHEQYSASG